MADSMDWQRQNFKKGGSEPAPSQMNPKIQAGSSQMHSKIAKATHPAGGLVSGGNAVPHMANGGLVAGLAAGLAGAYMMSKNKEEGGSSKMISGADVEERQGKPGVSRIDVEDSFTDNMPAKASASESNPVDKGVTDEPQKSKMYTAQPSTSGGKAAEPVKAKPVARKPVSAKAPEMPSGAAAGSQSVQAKASPIKSKENEDRPTKPYPDVVDRSIRAEAKSGVKTVYEDKPFSFQKKNEEDRAAAAKDAADREAKARSRKVGSDIRYNEAGDAY